MVGGCESVRVNPPPGDFNHSTLHGDYPNILVQNSCSHLEAYWMAATSKVGYTDSGPTDSC